MSPDPGVAEQSPQIQRRRLTLLVHLAASGGQFSEKLSDAVGRATDAEIRIMSDLVDGGMTIPALVHLLQGAHVLVGDDSRYQAWIFPTSRRRLSSHHRNVDKRATPDYGYDGPLVRESLHGKAATGTWVQFERTKATFRWGQLPTWDDVLHIRDYAIYRVTGKNVGPWGLSANVDTRPIVLRPPNRTSGQGALRGLAILGGQAASGQGRSAGSAGDGPSDWTRLLSAQVPSIGPWGDLYAARRPEDPVALLPDEPWADELGEGLFGSLAVMTWTSSMPAQVPPLLDTAVRPSLARLDDSPAGQVVGLLVRGVRVPTRATRQGGGLGNPLALPDQEPDMTSPADPEPVDIADVGRVQRESRATPELQAQLEEFAELVRTGPVRLGSYTQAELAVVLGDAPALQGSSPEVLAEAARSLAARGVLFRLPDTGQVTVVGDLGLVLALVTTRIGTLEIRRGHSQGAANEPWRWLITVLPHGVVAIDRIDTLGLHRLSVHSAEGVAETLVDQLLDGPARIPRDEPPAVIGADEARVLLTRARTRWQLVLRRPAGDGVIIATEAHVVRTGENRVDLIIRKPDGGEHTRAAVDARSLRQFLVDLVAGT